MLKKKFSIFVAIVVTVSMIVSALASGSSPAYAAEVTADKSSVRDWISYLSDKDGNISTENIGRIWTDKTVSKDNITFDGGNDGKLTVSKEKDSDFLVALSAMSSTSNIMTKTDKPLDIVLVLDVSGSMRDVETTYEYTPIYQLNQDKTYYLEDGTKVEYVSFLFWNGWYRNGETDGGKVEPKTSADDKDTSHVQFYERKEKGTLDKMQALKDSVNKFVDTTDKLNKEITDNNKKHRIGLVKFAGKNNDTVGNSTYREDGYTYNYSQIVNHLTSDMDGIKTNVSALSPGGATRANLGMNHASRVLDNSRTEAQKVVIFFTDGEPNNSNGFVADVANEAISKAKSLKDKNTLIYSVGIFAGANPDVTTDNFNGYMHGVSSNYPDATAYKNLGERAKDSNYYKAATNASELNTIFEEIAGDIQKSAQGAPTQVQDGFEDRSGYITFKDELGAYMKCDGFTDIVFAGKHFIDVTNLSETDGDGNTVNKYKFTGTGDNNLYPDGDLSDIIITVTSYKDISKGDLVEVKIPATLIPVRNFNIADGKMTVDETHPIRIMYNASVKDGVIEDVIKDGKVVKPALIKNPDKQFEEYLKKNKTDDGKVKFFSNMWSGGENGDTTATFEPASTNSFYKFAEDTQLFKKTTGDNYEPVKSLSDIKLSSSDEYFFMKSYYTAPNSGGNITKHDVRSYIRISTLDNLEKWMYEKDGKVYIKQGTGRLLRINDFIKTPKESNETNTANYKINPLWDDAMTNIVVHLGNNGLVTAQASGTLSVSKKAQIADGMIGPVDKNGNSTLDEQIFTFEISADTADGQYTSMIFTKNPNGSENASEASTVEFKDKKATVKLKNKERIEIYGLKDGAKFTVKETGQPKGFKQITPKENGSVTGTISEVMSKADFVNEYSAEPVKDVTSAYLGVTGTKILDGRQFEADDVFKFVITLDEKAPGSVQNNKYVLTINGDNYLKTNKAKLDFGNITFDKPGRYQYRITEYLPTGQGEDKRIPSITYDSTQYLLIVNVKDNGEGNLEIENFKINKKINPQLEQWETIFNSSDGSSADKGYINFTNTYNIEQQAVSLRGLKQLTNKDLNDYGEKQFDFIIAPAGSKAIDSTGDYSKDENQPMPKEGNPNPAGKYVYKNGPTGMITMPNITFDKDDIGKEYKYVISELQPTKNGKMDGEAWTEDGYTAVKVGDNWTYKGITFDNTSTEITIKVETTEVNGEDIIKTTIVSSKPGPAFEGGGVYDFVFKNTYNANLANEITLNGSKHITGREFTKEDSFKFKVEAQNGAPSPEKSEVTINPTNGKDVTFNFGQIHFSTSNMKGAVKQQDGTYKKDFTYKITEIKGEKKGLTYDAAPVMATVTVTDDGFGKLTATVKYTKNGKKVDDATFTNTYESSLNFGSVGGLDVTKTLNGRDMVITDAFEFTIKGVDTADSTTAAQADAKLTETDKKFITAQDAKAGKAVTMNKLNNVRFTEKDAGKTYTYEVAETKGMLGGITYDTSKYTVAIRVIDNFDGTLHTVTDVTKDGTTKTYDSSKSEKPIVAFTNSYNASSVGFDTARAQFQKILNGRPVEDDDKFTFKVEKASFNGETSEQALGKMPITKNNEVTLTGEEINKPFTFGSVKFTEPGVYKYKVSEVIPEDKIAGITYDNSELSVTITVEDDLIGNLKVTKVEVPYNTFENTYNAEPTVYDTKGTDAGTKFTKVLEGREWNNTDVFAFTISPVDNAPKPKDENGKEVTHVQVTKPDSGKSADFGFGQIKFDKAGEYTYKVKEIKPPAESMIPGITYDEHEATLKITVTDNKKGKLEVSSVTLENGKFTNNYDSKNVTIDPSAKVTFTKTLSGRDWKNGETFKFTISPKSFNDKTDVDSIDKIPMPQNTQLTVEKPETGNSKAFNFGSITFAKVGKYVYEVKEVVPAENPKDGLTYDTHSEEMTVVVTDNNDGTKTAKVTLDGEPVFKNEYKADPVDVDTDKYGTEAKGLFTKKLIGRDSKSGEAFNFNITAVTKDAPMPKKATKSVKDLNNGVDKDFGFGTITFDKVGTYEYNVVEENAGKTIDGLTYASNTAKLTVKVTDDTNGKLVATASVANPTFENVYKAAIDFGKIGAKFSITKSLSGRDMTKDQFSFEIKAKDEASSKVFEIPVAGKTVKSPAANMDAKAVVSTIENIKFTEADSNKTYGFTVDEIGTAKAGYTYDETKYDVNIKVADLANGKLEATVEVSDGNNTTTHVFTPDTAALKGPIELAFNNAYNANNNNKPVSVKATKTLNGRNLKANEFNFAIKDAKGAVVAKGTNEANGNINFEKTFTYNIEQLNKMVVDGLATKSVVDNKNVFTIKYIAEEVGNMPAGVTMTAGNFSFNIKVTDNGDGTLATEVVYPNGGISFVNTYTVGTDNIPLAINGSKVLKADEGLVSPSIDGKFTFTMTAREKDAPLPENISVTNDETGNIQFGKMVFKLDMLKDVTPNADGSRNRVFNYTVTESGQVAGITNDKSSTRNFTVELKDDGKGNLSVTPSNEAMFKFTNTYAIKSPNTSSVTDQIKITKKLTGRDMLAGEFKFELVDKDNKVVSTGTNDAKGNIVFKAITYNKPGDFTYTIREVQGNKGGVGYDATSFTINTTVTDNSDGTLSVRHETNAKEVVFNNTYKAQKTSIIIGAAKKLVNKDLEANQFEFKLMDENGKVIDTSKNDDKGQIIFDAIEFDKTGTYKYQVAEVKGHDKNIKYDENVYTVTVKVTDNKEGNLVANATMDDENGIVFVNTYEIKEKPTQPSQPDKPNKDKPNDSSTQTGDSNSIGLLVGLMALATGGIFLFRRKEK